MELLGDKALDRALAALDVKDQRKISRKGLRAGGRILLSETKRWASYISDKLVTGLKLRALKRRAKRGRAFKLLGVVVMTPTKRHLDIKQDAKGYWPAHVEMGFKHVGGKHIPARSYLRRAADNNQERVFRAVVTSTWDEIRKIWKRGR
jgi:hypothetical protein